MKLVHLFPDLMNLYGDRGNLLILGKYLEERHIPCEICAVHPGETLELDDVGLIYMGPGTEPARNAALGHLEKLSGALREGFGQVPMLFTGNAWLTLGQHIVTGDGETLTGLGLLDVEATETWDKRYTGDAIAQDGDGGPLTVGFLNKCDVVTSAEPPLFTMVMGEGNTSGGKEEGVLRDNLFATHLLGPVLVKNPHLLAQIGELLGVQPDPVSQEKTEAELAYEVTLKALQERMKA